MWSMRFCSRHIGLHEPIYRPLWALHRRVSWGIIKPPPICHYLGVFLSPRSTDCHNQMNMETIKGFLAPFGLNTTSIQDTLARIFRSSGPDNDLSDA